MYPPKKSVIVRKSLAKGFFVWASTGRLVLKTESCNRKRTCIARARNTRPSNSGPVQMTLTQVNKEEEVPHVVDRIIQNHNILWLSRRISDLRKEKLWTAYCPFKMGGGAGLDMVNGHWSLALQLAQNTKDLTHVLHDKDGTRGDLSTAK
jgi:hypothetical protein